MNAAEWRLRALLAKKPLSIAGTVFALALFVTPIVSFWLADLENEKSQAEANFAAERDKLAQMRADWEDLAGLKEALARWQASGLLAPERRGEWFERLQTLAGSEAKLEMAPPAPIEGIAGGVRHPIVIETSERIETEALDLASRLEREIGAPLVIERCQLGSPGERGLTVRIEASLQHVDPGAVEKTDASSGADGAIMKQ